MLRIFGLYDCKKTEEPKQMNKRSLQTPQKFLDKFVDMPRSRADKHYEKYLQIMREQILRQLPYIDNDQVNINLDRLWKYQFKYKNKIYYIWQEFSQIEPYVYIHNVGNNIKNHISIGRIVDQKLLDLLIDTGDTVELIKTYFGDISLYDTVSIPIDMKSLRGYIASTEYSLQNKDNKDNHYHKMYSNLRQAKYIKLIAEHYYKDYGCYILPHIKSKSIYGRTYYKGINIQNISKEVRGAVLGTHHQYDLYAAIFAIKLYLAGQILVEHQSNVYNIFTYTTDYLQNKDVIRERLGSLIHRYPDGVKLVKEAITAIGFGARLSGGAWLQGLTWQTSSIKDIIKNKEDFLRFISDDWVKNFHKEQKLLTTLITEYYLQDSSFSKKIDELPDIKSQNGNYNKHKVMSYLFQHCETMIMDVITEDINTVIRIHDAFITKNKLPTQTFIDIKKTLYDTSEFFKLEHTEIQGWNSFEAVTEEIRHKEFIKQEELRANNGILPSHYKKHIPRHMTQTDNTYYDSYDIGSNHEEYDIEQDSMLENMSNTERQEHYRIVGHNVNKYPDHIQKLINNQ